MKNISLLSKENEGITGVLPKACKSCVKGKKETIYITFKCNKTCWYCSNPEKYKNRDLVFYGKKRISNVLQLRNILKKSSITDLVISGGEPLLNQELLLPIIKLCKELKISSCLYTNGDLLTKDLFYTLMNKGLNEVKISLHDYKIKKEHIELYKNNSNKIFFEIVFLPDKVKEIDDLIFYLGNNNINSIIIDEVEIREEKVNIFYKKGYFKDENYIIKNSLEKFLKVFSNKEFNFFYCPRKKEKHKYE